MTSPTAGSVCDIDRFRDLWQRCLVDNADDSSVAIHRRLLDGYNEPQRHYHNLAHIEHCLGMFDRCKSQIGVPDAVELAIWFHDVIYEPGADDNEARSAALYQQLAAGVHQTAVGTQVDELIMATLHLGDPIEGGDTEFMIDIDLSSFGLPWEEFLQDSQNLRLENPQISDEDYYRNASNFQSRLLAKDRFYQSDYFYQQLETQARKNLADYFEYMRKQA